MVAAAALCGVAPNAKFLSQSTLLLFLFFLLRPGKKKSWKFFKKKPVLLFVLLLLLGSPAHFSFLLSQAHCVALHSQRTLGKKSRDERSNALCGNESEANWLKRDLKTEESALQTTSSSFWFSLSSSTFIGPRSVERRASERVGGWVVAETKSSARVRKKMF